MSGNTRQTSPENAAPSPPMWRTFVRALALALDAQVGPDVQTAILRAAGQQMATMLALPTVDSLDALELEMNDILGEIGWGNVRLTLREAERFVMIDHAGLPRVGSAGDPPGTWFAPVLEGLYQSWMGQQPGADPSFRTSVKTYEEHRLVIRYGR